MLENVIIVTPPANAGIVWNARHQVPARLAEGLLLGVRVLVLIADAEFIDRA
jgi:hypothetical protein